MKRERDIFYISLSLQLEEELETRSTRTKKLVESIFRQISRGPDVPEPVLVEFPPKKVLAAKTSKIVNHYRSEDFRIQVPVASPMEGTVRNLGVSVNEVSRIAYLVGGQIHPSMGPIFGLLAFGLGMSEIKGQKIQL